MALTSPTPQPPLWVRVLLILLGLAFAWMLVGGCARLATDRGIHREAIQRRLFEIANRDTIIYRDRVRADTLVRLDTLRQTDTIRLTRDRLRVQVVRDRDTLRISGECKADTIRVPVVRTIVRPPDPEPWYRRWQWVLAGTGIGAALVLLTGLWRRRV